MVLNALEKMHAHLTAAVVSNDPLFIQVYRLNLSYFYNIYYLFWGAIYFQDIVGKTVNGTTYVGLRARTTGAPQNHW